jgi:hypothetical protein
VEAGAEGSVLPDSGDDGGYCCAPDPAPGCCMKYGGWSGSGGCETLCDGMPEPHDPAWHLVQDSHGCQTWSSAGSTGPLCGAVAEAGADGGCTGTAPLCFGDNANMCCGNDPAGFAVCANGAWMCMGAPAPGCNGVSCLQPDAGGD